MKSSLFFIVVSFFVLAFSCEDTENDSVSQMEEGILGDWNWSNSIYTQTASGNPFILTPDSTGYKIRYSYNEDGSFTIFKNDIKDGDGIYWFEEVLKVEDSLSVLKLFQQKDNLVTSLIVSISEDTLVLDDSEISGVTKTFLRYRNK